MSIADDVKNFFDELIGESRVQSYTAEGIRPDAVLSRIGSESHKIDVDEINAIKQQTSKGFRIVDIDPNLLSRDDFYCVYSDIILKDYIGNDNLPEFTGLFGLSAKYDNTGTPVATPQSIQAPYWRSVSLPLEGDFLKIEFLPHRQNLDEYLVAPVNQTFVENTSVVQNSIEIAPTVYPGSYQISGQEMLLLDFENPSQKPLIVKNGSSYNTYFSNIILSFKQNSPRIRITVGVNSTITDQKVHPQSLSIWDAKGLGINSLQAPKSFSISNLDFVGADAGMVLDSTVGTQNNFRIIEAPTQGVGVMWITGFNIGFTQQQLNPSIFGSVVSVELVIGRFVSLNNIVSTERVAVGFIHCDPTNQVRIVNPSFTEARRICLNPGEDLILKISAQGSSGAVVVQGRVVFELCGYTHGSLFGEINPFTGVDQTAPFNFSRQLTENPYATDLERWGVPNR